ncbi:MAG TPA: hypothetical protein DCL41_00925 [Bdellovibrionales bacterium]|nr:hypothetical protein [Pseudobdellovibrionaceae bacterium]HAG90400.1 hypothetical protein [Bdellovibrionales bacterium]|tara:strand:- start:4092 stop:4481 length:390 start_codon:yes stop_codon:yes gene_type:complete
MQQKHKKYDVVDLSLEKLSEQDQTRFRRGDQQYQKSDYPYNRTDISFEENSRRKAFLPSDEKLKAEVEGLLDHDEDIHLDQLQVEVKEGWVHLRGEVPKHWLKERASSLISKIDGVYKVQNDIEVAMDH